jgi:uncharacterized protein YjbJ (UPF0337 family)
MSAGDKLGNNVDKVGGIAKEKFGDATGDDETKAEGKSDQTKSDVKQAGEKIKDAFKH